MSGLTYLGIASMLFCVWFTWYQAFGRVQGSDYGTSPRAAVIEAWINIVIGFSINFAINLFMIPLMTDGAHLKPLNNWWGGWFFTVVSMVRQYGIRRWCAHRLHAMALSVEGWIATTAQRFRTS